MTTAMLVLILGSPYFDAQDDKAAEDALDAFKSAYKTNSEADRVAAVNDLAKVHHAKTLTRLAPLLSTDGTTVRIAAAKGIAEFVELKKPAAAALTAGMAANARETTVHAALYDALGKLEELSSLPVIHRGFEEKETAVARAAVLAAGQVGNAGSIDPLIALLAKLEKVQKAGSGGGVGYTTPGTGAAGGASVTLRNDDAPLKRASELIPAINKALNDITREANATAETWTAWWSKNKATFKSLK
jgi:HEAT repeat protein